MRDTRIWGIISVYRLWKRQKRRWKFFKWKMSKLERKKDEGLLQRRRRFWSQVLSTLSCVLFFSFEWSCHLLLKREPASLVFNDSSKSCTHHFSRGYTAGHKMYDDAHFLPRIIRASQTDLGSRSWLTAGSKGLRETQSEQSINESLTVVASDLFCVLRKQRHWVKTFNI